MPKMVDLTGKIFGQWIVIKNVGINKHGRAVWLCKCSCGKEVVVNSGDLLRGKSSKCSTCHLKYKHDLQIIHGKAGTSIYVVWTNIKHRCYNPKDKDFHNYGGRENPIILSNEFRNSFKCFYDYVSTLDNFGVKGYTLDRINTDGHYERGNLRWANRTVQSLNKRITGKNKSGYIGVYYSTRSKKWVSSITLERKTHHLGYYNNAFDAHLAREAFINDYYPTLSNKSS